MEEKEDLAKVVNVIFQSEQPKFEEATKEYSQIWQEDGKRIISTIEKFSDLPSKENQIDVTVYEGISYSGNYSESMHLRASYPHDTKKAALVHELLHRQLFQNKIKVEPNYNDSHYVIDLLLYDIWLDLYGEDFALEQIRIEGLRKGSHDYEGIWKWALAMSYEQRQQAFQQLKEKSAQ